MTSPDIRYNNGRSFILFDVAKSFPWSCRSRYKQPFCTMRVDTAVALQKIPSATCCSESVLKG